GMASRGRRGVLAREGEQRRDEPRREVQGEQQAPAPQGPVLPPPPPVDYGVFMPCRRRPTPRLHYRLSWRLNKLRSESTCGGP
ncbi:hypothetical protein Taro_005688, partial [Colocasia esculenta]|nr:hypothetical protein [Colocasia esculenta]